MEDAVTSNPGKILVILFLIIWSIKFWRFTWGRLIYLQPHPTLSSFRMMMQMWPQGPEEQKSGG